MTVPPLVTALLPAYNAEAFIGRTLDSLAAQTWPNLEVLIADDCSTDGTLALIEAWAAGRSNVRILSRPRNLGWVGNCNDMMGNARGELLFFAFHDDLVGPRYVEQLAQALVANPDAVLAYSDVGVTTPDGERTEQSFDALAGAATPLGRGVVMAGQPTNWWVPNRGLFRAAAFRRIGGMHRHAAGEFSADWPWLLHLALLGRFVRVPGTLVEKFYFKTSLSRSWTQGSFQRRSLRRAGMRDAWRSDLGLFSRALLATYIGLNLSHVRAVLRRLGR